MSKKVKLQELKELLLNSFRKACKNNGFASYDEVIVEVKINTIYAKISFSFKDKKTDFTNKAQKISEDFTNNLRKYVGDNVVANPEIGATKDSTHDIILQVDYDIIE